MVGQGESLEIVDWVEVLNAKMEAVFKAGTKYQSASESLIDFCVELTIDSRRDPAKYGDGSPFHMGDTIEGAYQSCVKKYRRRDQYLEHLLKREIASGSIDKLLVEMAQRESLMVREERWSFRKVLRAVFKLAA